MNAQERETDLYARVRQLPHQLACTRTRYHNLCAEARSLRMLDILTDEERVAEAPSKEVEPPRIFSAKLLIQKVADDFDISFGELIGRGHENLFVDARAVMVRLLRNRGWSFPRIGRALGGRDHSTIINLHNKYSIYERRNATVAESYERHRAAGAVNG